MGIQDQSKSCKNILKARGRGEKDKGMDYRERNKLEKVKDTKLIYRQFKKKKIIFKEVEMVRNKERERESRIQS